MKKINVKTCSKIKNNILVTFTLLMFTITLIFGAWILAIAMLIIFPLAILRCMFDINTAENNEGI